MSKYQRMRCYGFTTQELIELETFAPLYDPLVENGKEDGGVDLGTLQSTPIHPIFAPSKWGDLPFKQVGKIPLGKGRPGYFEVRKNPSLYETVIIWNLEFPRFTLNRALDKH